VLMVLAGYLHDRLSAAHFRVAPTGHGRRESFASEWLVSE